MFIEIRKLCSHYQTALDLFACFLILQRGEDRIGFLALARFRKISFELADQRHPFFGVIKNLQVQLRLHQENLGDFVGFLVLVFGEQSIEFLHFLSQVFFRFFALSQLALDFADQNLEIGLGLGA